MKKLFLCMFLLAALGLFVACGSGDDNGDTGTGPETTETAQNDGAGADTPAATPAPDGTGFEGVNWDENVTFTWFIPATPANDYYTSYNENPVIRYLEYRFNVTFDFQQAPVGTEADHMSLMMGAGRHTDAMHLGHYLGNIAQLYEDGVIIDIAQWLDYMPNFRNLLETNRDFARRAFNDDGRIFQLITIRDEPNFPFSGLVYRHDILETMTDGNVQFPSGNDVPTTLADWEYMLPLFLEYFQMTGRADYAPLILPPEGMIHFGALMNTFGAHSHLFSRDGVIYNGLLEPEFLIYLNTMIDWFERGWIHQDFVTRVGDMFFMPNPPLVFGGGAGVWYGMSMHLGDRMSMPEHGMNFDVRPIPSPISPGVTHQDMLRRREDEFGMGRHSAVSSTNPDIGRFLATMDFLYSEEGAKLVMLGVNAEQIAPHDTVMARMGMSEGAWWFDEAGNIVRHHYIDMMGGHIGAGAINGIRLPGFFIQSIENAGREAEMVVAHAAWTAHCAASEVRTLPEQLTLTTAEAAIVNANDARLTDLTQQVIPMFIMGARPLNDETWAEFIDQLHELGMAENVAIWQAAYERFLVRGQ